MKFGSETILLVILLSVGSQASAQSCQNGGTFDNILYECRCPPTAYGANCESLFSATSPCFNLSAVPIISDATGVHAAGNGVANCGSSCVDFNSLPAVGRWYRVQSPHGNYIVSSYPCRPLIGCGTGSPYTLRNLVLELRNENGSLYSAKAYPFDTAFPSCYSTGALFYSVRLLVCPSNDTVYFLTPTSDPNHRYCMGVNIVTTTAPTTTATTTATATTTTTTTTTPTITFSATITKSDVSTPASNKSNTSSFISRQQWNIVANDSTPYVKVNLNSPTHASSLVCRVRSNSAWSSLNLEAAGNPADSGQAVYCDLKPVLHWLSVNGSLYVNCLVEVMDVITEVTVCQIRFNDKAVRYVDNRGQCATVGFTESDAGVWQKWFQL